LSQANIEGRAGLAPAADRNPRYLIGDIVWEWSVELEPEVEAWLRGLSDEQLRCRGLLYIELLEERGIHLAFPYSSHLRRGDLRELRFYLGRTRQRITYFIAGRRNVVLTVFHKTARQERAEIDRAERAMQRCRAEGHTVDEET
jgi:hypothetical protein